MNPNVQPRQLPRAPVSLIAGIAISSRIRGIVDMRVTKDNGVLMEVIDDPTTPITVEALIGIVEVCGCTPGDIQVLQGDPTVPTLVVAIAKTAFDFSVQFLVPGDRVASPPIEVTPVNTGDSDESFEASAALLRHRSQNQA